MLQDTTITNNTANAECGGVAGGKTNLLFGPGNSITGNTAAKKGGGLCPAPVPTKVWLAPRDPNCDVPSEPGGSAAWAACGQASMAGPLQQVTEGSPELQQVLQMVQGNTAPLGPDLIWAGHCDVGAIPDGAICRKCDKNMFSLNPRNTSCDPCPPNAVCPGGAVLLPAQDYWHSANRSTNMIFCPGSCEPFNDTTYNATTSVCKEGHEGPLCGVCSEGWGLSVPFKCVECLNIRASWALYASGAAGLLVFLYFYWHLTLSDNASGKRDLTCGDVLVVITIWAQSIEVLTRLKLQWPTTLLRMLFPFSWLVTGGTALSPIRCLMQGVVGYAAPYVEPSAATLLLTMLAPLSLVVLAMLLKLVLYYLHKQLARGAEQVQQSSQQRHWRRGVRVVGAVSNPLNVEASLKRQLAILLPVALFVLYPQLLRPAVSLFACQRLDYPPPATYPQYSQLNHSRGYWEHDMNMKCYTGWHAGYALALGIPVVLLLIVGWPAYILGVITRWRNELDQPHVFKKYGGLYKALDRRREWWCAVEPLQMAALVCISTFINSLGPYYCMLLLTLLYVVLTAGSCWFRPFRDPWLQLLHSSAMFCLWATSYGALYFTGAGAGAQLSKGAPDAIAVLLVVLNFVFLAGAVGMLGRLAWHHIQQNKDSLRAWVGCMCCRRGKQEPMPPGQPGTSSGSSSLHIKDVEVCMADNNMSDQQQLGVRHRLPSAAAGNSFMAPADSFKSAVSTPAGARDECDVRTTSVETRISLPAVRLAPDGALSPGASSGPQANDMGSASRSTSHDAA